MVLPMWQSTWYELIFWDHRSRLWNSATGELMVPGGM